MPPNLGVKSTALRLHAHGPVWRHPLVGPCQLVTPFPLLKILLLNSAVKIKKNHFLICV